MRTPDYLQSEPGWHTKWASKNADKTKVPSVHAAEVEYGVSNQAKSLPGGHVRLSVAHDKFIWPCSALPELNAWTDLTTAVAAHARVLGLEGEPSTVDGDGDGDGDGDRNERKLKGKKVTTARVELAPSIL